MDNAESFRVPPGGAHVFNYNGEDQDPFGFIPHPYAIQQQEGMSRRPNISTNPARQPKPRKRPNGLNRERTVTTLTGHLYSQFSTPGQQPAGSFFTPVPYAAESMSSMAMMNTQGYDMSEGYGFEMPVGPMYHPTMNHNHNQPMRNSQQQQAQDFPKGTQRQQHGPLHQSLHHSRPSYDSVANTKDKPALPNGKDDLTILQNLKKLILENQHPFYKAIPKPEYLAQLYKGQIPTDAPATESISNGRTSALEPHLKVEPGLVDIGGAGALEAEGETPLGLGQGCATQQNPGTNAGPQAVSAPQVPLPKVIVHESFASGTQPPTSEKFAVPMLSSVRLDALSPSALRTSNVPPRSPTKQYASPSSADVKPAVHPPHGTEAAPDSMPVDAPPQSAALEVSTVKKASPVPLIAPIDKELPPGESVVAVSVLPSQPQRPLSVRNTQTTDSRKPAGVPAPTSLSVPAEETVPFDGNQPASNRPTPSISAVAPPVATDIVPFGGTSSLIPGLGPVVSTSGFAPVLTSARPSVQHKPVVDPRSLSASAVTPSVSVARPPNVPASTGPPPAPVNLPAADQVTRPSLKERLERPPVQQQSRLAGEPSSESLSHLQDRDASNTNSLKGRNKRNQNPPYTGPPKSGDRSYNRPPGPTDGPPPANAPLRAPFRGRSPPPDNRKLPVSPGSRGPPPRDFRAPPVGRSPSRERGGYSRPPPHDFVEARRHTLDMDGPPPGRYDGRPLYDDYPAAPPLSGGRGPPPDVPPSSGREEYYGSYAQGQDRNVRWEDPYHKRDWERGPPPVSADRGRFDRDYEPPGSWERVDRDFGDRDSLYPEDDRYTPREPERARPPAPYTPMYGRVRGRSPSPIGRPGPGDSSRPPVKRPREDFGPEYYPGPGGGGAGRPPVRRGPPGDYAPPPRSGGGPGGADWNSAGGGPLPTSASSMGGGIPGNRDYLGRGDASMEYSPLPDNYDRPRSTPPTSGGRAPYGGGGGRGPYNRGPERYGGMRIPP